MMSDTIDSIWTGWDGRRLSWNVERSMPHSDAAPRALELCIDGVRFAPVDGTQSQFDFAASPSGNARIDFSLRGADGVAIGLPWRVLHGQPATAGVDQWQGDYPALRSFARSAVPARTNARISIVVPIYNSPQCVQRCIESVLRWTQGAAQLILIDDASSDPAIGVLLARYAHAPNIVLRRNDENLGYTRSTNLGIELAGRDDVVLLNSDTEVGPRWLDALCAAAYGDDALGTVTAVSDNAGAFTVPELEQYCPIPSRWTLVQAQRALLQHAGGALPELPTGNGFCMYVKRALFDRVGVLDAQAFPSGYGEENDLCQRAEHAGFRHAIAGNVLVRHARSASFGHERRAALGAQGMAVLRTRYPDYEAKVGATLFSFARRVLDYRVRRLYADSDGFYAIHPPRPRLLLVGQAVALAGALRERYACCALRPGGGFDDLEREGSNEHAYAGIGATNLIAALTVGAIELVHLHRSSDAGALAELAAAARAAGVPCVDTSEDATLSAKSETVENAYIAARCARLYQAAWRARASFADFSDGDFT